MISLSTSRTNSPVHVSKRRIRRQAVALTSLALLVACSDETVRPESEKPSSGISVTRVETVSELPTCNPSRRGAVYYVSDEEQFYFCDGRALLAIDVPGEPGADGTSWLVVLDDADPADCEDGGVVISVGPDDDGDGELDVLEVAGRVAVCDGADGADGKDGTDGTDGTDGADGHDSLIETDREAPGANCENGGLRVTTGVDADRNGRLSEGEVSQVQYVCSPPAGMGGMAGGGSGGMAPGGAGGMSGGGSGGMTGGGAGGSSGAGGSGPDLPPSGDADGDGVPNGEDNCPELVAEQVDFDGDGHGDACDLCPENPNPGTMPCPYAISLVRQSLPPNTPVQVTAWVTAVRDFGANRGFTIQDSYGPYSGIFVFTGLSSPGVNVGDVVTVSGVSTEFQGRSEIISPEITVGGQMEVIPGTAPDTDRLSHPVLGDAYESMLIDLRDVTISNANPDAPNDFDEFSVASFGAHPLRVDDAFLPGLDNVCDVGSTFISIVGVIDYSFNNFKLEPRDRNDIGFVGCDPVIP